MLYRKIDMKTGLFLEDVVLNFNPNPKMYIEEIPDRPYCKPKWNGLKWEEGATHEELLLEAQHNTSQGEPEPELEVQVVQLKNELEQIQNKLSELLGKVNM